MTPISSPWRHTRLSLRALALCWMLLLAGWLLTTEIQAPAGEAQAVTPQAAQAVGEP